MVFHIYLLVELGPICISMAASFCLKSCDDHSLLKSYIGGLCKTFTGLGPRNPRQYQMHIKANLKTGTFEHAPLDDFDTMIMAFSVKNQYYQILSKTFCYYLTFRLL